TGMATAASCSAVQARGLWSGRSSTRDERSESSDSHEARLKPLSHAEPSVRESSLLVHHVNDDVDGEPGVVFAEEALVAPVVVPLAAVVLVAVEHGGSAAALDAFQVFVHDIVAPAVELVRRSRRPALEREEAAVDRMRDGQL